MYKLSIIPVIIFLFVLQTNNFLFASENVEAKAEVSTVVAEAKTEDNTAAVVEKEANAEESATAVAEKEVSTEESTSAVTEEVVTTEESPEVAVKTENDVIATVNGEEVLRKDFEKMLNAFRRKDQDVTNAFKLEVLNRLVGVALINQFLKKQDVSVSNEEVQRNWEIVMSAYKRNPDYAEKSDEEILHAFGLSASVFKQKILDRCILNKYLDSIIKEDEQREYFDTNKDAFNGARVRASHILIDTRSMKTDAEKEEAKKMIDIVKIEIDKGADFAEMAKKYSNCPSAKKGGDIGFFQRKGSTVEEFAKVAFAMDVGEISGPITTQFGYHLIEVTEKEEGKDVSYEEMSDMVDAIYLQIKTAELMKDLFDKAKIEILL